MSNALVCTSGFNVHDSLRQHSVNPSRFVGRRKISLPLKIGFHVSGLGIVLLVFSASLLFSGCTSMGNVQGTATADDVVPATRQIDEIEIPDVNDIGGADATARVRVQSCMIPDPAIDRATNERGISFAPIAHEIHAGLFGIVDDDGASSLVPELVESYVVSDDNMVYDLTLRKDLKFSDGSALTAFDVKWSWERTLRKAQAGGRATTVLGDVVGADEVLTRRHSELSGVDVIDERRLQVRLTRPQPIFPMMIADPVASVLKERNVAEWPVEWTNDSETPVRKIEFEPVELPVGAGPFKLEKFVSHVWEGECTIVRNDHYWGDPAKISKIEYLTGSYAPTSESARVDTGNLLFAQGRIDVRLVLSDELDEILEGARSDSHVFVNSAGPPSITYLVFNPAVQPFDDPDFRRALVATSDVSAAFNEDGETTPVAIRIMPASLVWRDSEISRIPYNLVAAMGHLEASSWMNPPPMVYRSNQFGYFHDSLGRLFEQWGDVLDVSVFRGMDDGTVPLNLQAMKLVYRSPAFPDAYAVLSPIPDEFGTKNQAPEFVELRGLIEDAISESDAAERATKYDLVEDYVLQQALVLPIRTTEGNRPLIVQPWVHNFQIPRYSGSVFHRMEFDETAPQR